MVSIHTHGRTQKIYVMFGWAVVRLWLDIVFDFYFGIVTLQNNWKIEKRKSKVEKCLYTLMWKREAEPMSMVHCLNSAREKQQQQQHSHKNQDKYIIHIYSEILNDYQNLYTMKRFVCFFLLCFSTFHPLSSYPFPLFSSWMNSREMKEWNSYLFPLGPQVQQCYYIASVCLLLVIKRMMAKLQITITKVHTRTHACIDCACAVGVHSWIIIVSFLSHIAGKDYDNRRKLVARIPFNVCSTPFLLARNSFSTCFYFCFRFVWFCCDWYTFSRTQYNKSNFQVQ